LAKLPKSKIKDIKGHVLRITFKYEAKPDETLRLLSDFGINGTEADLTPYIEFRSEDPGPGLENNTEIRRDLEKLTLTSRILNNFWHVLTQLLSKDKVEEAILRSRESFKQHSRVFTSKDIADFVKRREEAVGLGLLDESVVKVLGFKPKHTLE